MTDIRDPGTVVEDAGKTNVHAAWTLGLITAYKLLCFRGVNG